MRELFFSLRDKSCTICFEVMRRSWDFLDRKAQHQLLKKEALNSNCVPKYVHKVDVVYQDENLVQLTLAPDLSRRSHDHAYIHNGIFEKKEVNNQYYCRTVNIG